MVANQNPNQFLNIIGQLAGWYSISSAFSVLIKNFNSKNWIFLLMFGIVSAKVLRLFSIEAAELVYLVLVNLMYCIAGGVMFLNYEKLVRKQLAVILIINFVVVILQTVGAGAWTQALTTHGEGNLAESVSTLFVPEMYLDYKVVQGRPAGVLYSNVVLSLVVLLQIIIQLLDMSKSKQWGGTVVLCGVLVFSMSKFLFISLVIAVIYTVVFGYRWQKIYALKVSCITAALLTTYFILFPGLISVNLSGDTISTSFSLRANDIVGSVGADSWFKIFESDLVGTARASWIDQDEHVSGYATILQKFSLLNIVLMLFLIGAIYLMCLRKFLVKYSLGSKDRNLKRKIFLSLVLFIVFPISTPIWAFNLYWFMMGLPLMPLINILKPKSILDDQGSRLTYN